MHEPFIWDYNSDQPYPIKDKAYKKKMYKSGAFDSFKTFLTTIVLSPFIALKYLFLKDKTPNTDTIFAMAVELDKLPEKSVAYIDELGVKKILIRFPLWQMQRLGEYVEFIKSFQDKDIMLNILQDKEHIEDLNLTKKDIAALLEAVSPYIKAVQIGNAINRKKWGFASMSEYMQFYKVAAEFKKSYRDIAFVGSSTIDFEYHYTIRTLFNGFFPSYDKVASLLYVDRRGAPENTQMGFDLIKKIKLLYAITSLSRSKNTLVISEFNWPISNTAPYAPTSEKECVDEKTYTDYMVRSYLLALSTGMVETIYWHQLVASGYGLIDIREGIRKRDAFYAFAFMVKMLQGAKLIEYNFDKIYFISFEKKDTIIQIYWAKERTNIQISGELYDILGNKMQHYTIDETVVYKELKR